jgi:hypothetical protein
MRLSTHPHWVGADYAQRTKGRLGRQESPFHISDIDKMDGPPQASNLERRIFKKSRMNCLSFDDGELYREFKREPVAGAESPRTGETSPGVP